MSISWKASEVDKTSCYQKSRVQQLNYVNNIRKKNLCELTTLKGSIFPARSVPTTAAFCSLPFLT